MSLQFFCCFFFVLFFLKVTNECYTKYKLPISVLVILYFYFICIICKVTRIEKKNENDFSKRYLFLYYL